MILTIYSNLIIFNIIVYIMIAFGIVLFLLGLWQLLNSILYKYGYIQSYNWQKSIQYECGFDPFSTIIRPIEIKFYIIAVLFLIFDLEIVIILPIFLCCLENGIVEIMLLSFFLFLLSLGYLYEWKSGCLIW